MDESIKYCHIDLEDEKSFSFDHVHIVWNEQIAFHQSPSWELSYILRGSGTRVVGDNMETFSSGEVILLPPNLPHGWFFNEYDKDEEGKIENITIIFLESLLETFFISFPEMKATISKIRQIDKGLSFEGETLERIQELMYSMSGQNKVEQLSSMITLLHRIAVSEEKKEVGAFKKQNKSSVKIQEVSRYIVHNFQRNITLDDISRHFGMNRSSFCTFYKREKGKSFFTSLTEYRIDCSCLMLRDTDSSIAEICFAVGFNDVPHYNRTFRRLKGETPKDYRAKHRIIS